MKLANYIDDRARFAYFREYLHSRKRPNAVFIWIPKTAGNSLRQVLNAPLLYNLHLVKYRFVHKGIVTFGHMDYSQLVNGGYVPTSFDKSAYKFTFVRNPYDRTVSLYFYLKKYKRLPANISFLSFCRRLIENSYEPIGLYNVNGLSQCNPQIRWIENTKINHIGKFENVNNDTTVIQNGLGLHCESLPRLNVTSHPEYRDCYCNESKAIVEELYKDDFLSFDYKYEDFLKKKIE